MFSREYADQIDWESVEASCRKVCIDTFAAAVFQIIRKYLVPEIRAVFSSIHVDEGPLLEDVLSGGIYGLSDPDRVHSVNMTLSAAEAAKRAKNDDTAASQKSTGRLSGINGILHSVFPGNAYLQKNFPYAKVHPILIPVAWGHRIVHYVKRTPHVVKESVRTVKAGEKRTASLRKYKTIE